MNHSSLATWLLLVSLSLCNCTGQEAAQPLPAHVDVVRAQETLAAIYTHYADSNGSLLRENYPFDEQYTATYLADEEQAKKPNRYAYLWPYSGVLSAASALLHATDDKTYETLLDSVILPGLEAYFDDQRLPAGYASYINTAPVSDRFYDDNVWLGIDFVDIYSMTDHPDYLAKAKLIWEFVASGIDDKLGGGIYWCEQRKTSKNTCSNAPGAVFAFKLFQATGDSVYFHQGKTLYEWTKANLQDTTDGLYFDNIRLDGRLDKRKFPYNSGQMLQSAALLFKLTGEGHYLTEAQALARASYAHFFDPYDGDGEPFRLLKESDVWFIAVMMRGFTELYAIDHDNTYLTAFRKNLSHAWTNMREENGLFNKDWSGQQKEEQKWLLTQAAMVEMYARLAASENNQNQTE